MANNTNNGDASMNYYSNRVIPRLYHHHNDPSQTTDEDPDKLKIVAIALPVMLIVIVLLKLLCFWAKKKDREQLQDAGDGNRLRQSGEAGGWTDRQRAPSSSTVAGAAMDVAPVVRTADPPLVCTYRKADGWRDGSCGVCLAEMADGDVLRVLPVCLHYFHAACVGEWLRGHDTCPLCRAPLVGPAATA